MVRKFVAVLFALALIGASGSAAQIGIGLSGQYLSLGGDDYSNTDAGFGVEGNVLFPVGQSIRLGASGQWSSHDVSGQSISLIGALAEGRYMFGGGGKMTPYLGARGGWAQASGDISGTSVSASGYAFGGGVGVMIAMSPTLAIDLNGMYHTVSLGEQKASGTVVGPETSGTALQIRAGINFKLGGQ